MGIHNIGLFKRCAFGFASTSNGNVCFSSRNTLRFSRQPRNAITQEKFHPRNLVEPGSLPPEGYSLIRPVAFTAGVCVASYVGATIWQYENIRKQASEFVDKKKKAVYNWYQGERRLEWRDEMNRRWNGLTEGQRIFYPLLFINSLVFLAWKVGPWHSVMTQWFCSSPASRAVCWPMLFSTFSHYSVLHFLANMFVLNSFSNPAVNSLGMEQFLGLYVAGGVFAALTSNIQKIASRQNVRSLGASGAILTIFAFTCCQRPDSQLQLIFLPGFTFSAQTALVGAMALDVAGLLFGWKLFDHAAHLGGALFGLFWYHYGEQLWSKRGPILQWWHTIRET